MGSEVDLKLNHDEPPVSPIPNLYAIRSRAACICGCVQQCVSGWDKVECVQYASVGGYKFMCVSECDLASACSMRPSMCMSVCV